MGQLCRRGQIRHVADLPLAVRAARHRRAYPWSSASACARSSFDRLCLTML